MLTISGGLGLSCIPICLIALVILLFKDSSYHEEFWLHLSTCLFVFAGLVGIAAIWTQVLSS